MSLIPTYFCFVKSADIEECVLTVPLHMVILKYELFKAEETVGVQPALPVEGILGRDLACSKMLLLAALVYRRTVVVLNLHC